MNVYGMYDLQFQQHNNNSNTTAFSTKTTYNQLWLISLQLSIFNKTTYNQFWLIKPTTQYFQQL
jgi:hypothetical protein